MNWFNMMLDAVRSIADALQRIATVLEKMNVEQDFSAEDKIVLDVTKNVKEAKSRIPTEKVG